MAVYRPYFVELTDDQAHLRVTRKPVLVRHFVKDHPEIPQPPHRYDALRYLLANLTIAAHQSCLTLHARDDLAGSSRSDLLNARVTWIEQLPFLLVLHTDNRPERFDGTWAILPSALPDVPPSTGSGWTRFPCGQQGHAFGPNGSSLRLPETTRGVMPLLVASPESVLRATTVYDEMCRQTLLRPARR